MSAGPVRLLSPIWSLLEMKSYHLTFLLLLLFAAPALAQTSSGYLDDSGNWQWEHDTGTPGTSTGQLNFDTANPSLIAWPRRFPSPTPTNVAEGFLSSLGNNSLATNSFYNTYRSKDRG